MYDYQDLKGHDCQWEILDHTGHTVNDSLVDIWYGCYCGKRQNGVKTIDEFVEELKQRNNEDNG